MRKLISDWIYYMRRGLSPSLAWKMAKVTL